MIPALQAAQEALNAEGRVLAARGDGLARMIRHLDRRRALLASIAPVVAAAGSSAQVERHGPFLVVTFDLGEGAPDPDGGQ